MFWSQTGKGPTVNCLQAQTQAVCSRKQIPLSPPLIQIHTNICTYNPPPPGPAPPPTHKYIPVRAHTNSSFLLSVSYRYIPLSEKRNHSLSCYHTNTYCYLHKEILSLSCYHTNTYCYLHKEILSLSCYHTNTYWYLHKEIPLPHSNKKCIPVLPQTNPSLPLTQIHTSTSTNKSLALLLCYKCILILAQIHAYKHMNASLHAQ